MVIELLYGLSCIDREVCTQAKARSSEVPLQWCMLAALLYIFDFNVEAHSSSVEWSVVLVISL